jgi:hypothetical protein
MSKPEGFRCPKSHVGFPHGKDKRKERRERAYSRGAPRPKGDRKAAGS